jgi:transposase-like protein
MSHAPNTYKAFAPGEKERIIEDYKTMTAAEVAKKYGRTKASIISMVQKEREKAKAAPAPEPKRFVAKSKTPELPPAPEPIMATYTLQPRRDAKEPNTPPPQPKPQPTPEMVPLGEAKTIGYKGIGCDFKRTAEFLIRRLMPVNFRSIWLLMRYIIDGGGWVEVVSPYHTKDGKEYYFSIKVVEHDSYYYTAHLYGVLIGTHFTISRASIQRKGEDYDLTFKARE